MAGTIKGMTIEIGGNTEPLEQALKSTNKEINSTQKELNEVNKLLKFDPSNTELLKQKQQLLGEQIGNTKTKLDALKQAQKQFEEEAKKGGDINQAEYRKISREIENTENTLKKLKDEAKDCHPQLAKVEEALKKVGDVAGNIAKTTLDATIKGVEALGTASITASASVFKLAKDVGACADDLNALSSVSGLTTKQLQEFQYASDLIDVSTETLTGSLTKLTNNMNTAKKGSGDVYDTFKELGVEFQNTDGSLRNANDVFNEAITALGNVENETERDAMAMKLFGKSAKELNPLIEGGAEQLAEMSERANDLGLILSQEALDGANAFNDQLDILKANGKGLFNVIGAEVASQLTPAMKSLNDVTEEYIKEITSAFSTGNFEDVLQTLSGILGKVARKISESLPKIAKFGVNFIKSFVEAIKENAPYIANAVAELGGTLVEGLYEILPSLIETAIDLIASFVETIGEQLPTLIPTVVEGIINIANVMAEKVDFIIEAGLILFTGLVDGLQRALPKLVGALPEVITKIVQSIVEYIPIIIETVGDIIVAVANTIGGSANTLIPALIESILAILDAIIDNLPTIIDTIITVVLAIADAMIENVDIIIEGAVSLIVGLAEGLVRALPKLAERLPEIMMAIVNGLIELLPKLFDVAVNLIATLGQGIINAVGGLGEALYEVWEFIRDTFTKAFQNVKDIGKNLIEGLWNGIKNTKDWLISKIKGFCSDALDGIKAFFGIESPSKVMANEVGKYMATGIGVGFGNAMPSVLDAMKQKLSGVVGAMQTELSFGDIPQIQGNQIISENQYITRNYNNTVETIRQPQSVELVLDGTKLARTLIQPLNNEYNRLGVKI